MKILGIALLSFLLLGACEDGAFFPANGLGFEDPAPADPNPGEVDNTALCIGDVDGDGEVGFADLTELLGNWGEDPINEFADIDENGVVDQDDLQQVLDNWGNPDC